MWLGYAPLPPGGQRLGGWATLVKDSRKQMDERIVCMSQIAWFWQNTVNQDLATGSWVLWQWRLVVGLLQLRRGGTFVLQSIMPHVACMRGLCLQKLQQT